MPEAERAAFVAGSGMIRPGTMGPTTDGSDGPLPRAALCSAMQESAANAYETAALPLSYVGAEGHPTMRR